MNPVALIRPWLEACSIQQGIGATGFWELSHPDQSSYPPDIYFDYTFDALDEGSAAPSVSNIKVASDSYDVVVMGSQEWIAKVTVNLYNSQNGMSELAGVCIAAQKDQDVLNLFHHWGVGYQKGSGMVRNNSERRVSEPSLTSELANTESGVGIYYKHTMTCLLSSAEGFRHRKVNHRVGSINASGAFTLNEGE